MAFVTPPTIPAGAAAEAAFILPNPPSVLLLDASPAAFVAGTKRPVTLLLCVAVPVDLVDLAGTLPTAALPEGVATAGLLAATVLDFVALEGITRAAGTAGFLAPVTLRAADAAVERVSRLVVLVAVRVDVVGAGLAAPAPAPMADLLVLVEVADAERVGMVVVLVVREGARVGGPLVADGAEEMAEGGRVGGWGVDVGGWGVGVVVALDSATLDGEKKISSSSSVHNSLSI
ncbi:uncharacterized protein LAESUDRAFT_302870 [Laetiporus sulphureus 93-53]|uniref:Uncharacterized protein n=1 Tax=Laetiporus sulphureus 93-53 TaxID=1314785 RepID=A0A165D7S3_9APHY|nr:uncharacterized protein LAESUDRAFT_302870 [Laetiporus sulphureus 93-53]KZT04290.1 hypothetical protein LAESUDRAFT_302870 [Laetiporus sulphureus 93-53]